MYIENWFTLHRKIFNNEIWSDLKLFRFFVYLIGQAVFAKNGVDKGNIHIERGQLLKSYRKMQDELEYIENNAVKQYSLSTIDRMVNKLKDKEMIKTKTTGLGTLFTITNYAKYQDKEDKKDKEIKELRTQLEQQRNAVGTAAEQQRNNKNYVNKVNKVNKDKKEIDISNSCPVEKKQDIPYKEIVNHFNDRTGSQYKSTTNKTKELIKARWNEGFRLKDFKTVIDKKCVEWMSDEEMEKYLRPITLFGPKFESYLNQLSVKKSGQSKEDKQVDMMKDLYQEYKEEEE